MVGGELGAVEGDLGGSANTYLKKLVPEKPFDQE